MQRRPKYFRSTLILAAALTAPMAFAGGTAGTGGSGTPEDAVKRQQQQQPAQPAEVEAEEAGTGGSGTAAQPKPAPASQQQASGAALPLYDVEELNDQLASKVNQKVRVAGEVDDFLGPRTFVLESGGILDDEIAVVIPQNVQTELAAVRDDAELIVTGTVRRIGVVELERELGWDFEPELELEFEGTRDFLVAERIERQKD